ncbi:MAG TPA: FGGY-family carbohydrate kinase [Atribacteraceae bacterium]|nr:FGGY-family carbohydrate kinase [Atribacteraceae bacterium]
MALAGIDVGTSGCKVAVFREDGRLLANSSREYPFIAPRPGWLELDARAVWEAIKQALSEAVALSPEPVTVCGVASHGETLVPVDATGEPIANAIANFDVRAESYTSFWRERIDPLKSFQISGMPLHGMYTVNKLMWLRDNRPTLYDRARKFTCMEDYVIFRLNGCEPVIDYSLAARTMLFDVTEKRWAPELLTLAGIDREKLSRVVPSGEAAGTVCPAVADEVGLSRRVLIATGGHDQACGVLGCGGRLPGEAMYGVGTSECMAINLGREPILTREMMEASFCCYPHTETDSYITLTYIASGGSVLRWFRDEFGHEERRQAQEQGKDPYEFLIAGASARPASIFVLPHFAGSGTPYLDERSRGAIIGLTVGSGKGEITRAILESLTYEMKVNLDLFEEFGIPIGNLRVIGGGSRSPLWLQIKADILEKPLLTLSTGEAVALGTAMLAGKAGGVFKDLAQAREAMVAFRERVDPREEYREAYRERFRIYRKLYGALREINREISTLL